MISLTRGLSKDCLTIGLAAKASDPLSLMLTHFFTKPKAQALDSVMMQSQLQSRSRSTSTMLCSLLLKCHFNAINYWQLKSTGVFGKCALGRTPPTGRMRAP